MFSDHLNFSFVSCICFYHAYLIQGTETIDNFQFKILHMSDLNSRNTGPMYKLFVQKKVNENFAV